MKNDKKEKQEKTDTQLNDQLQGVDKAPGEETGKKEKVTNKDLKGKKVDGDPDDPKDQPAS